MGQVSCIILKCVVSMMNCHWANKFHTLQPKRTILGKRWSKTCFAPSGPKYILKRNLSHELVKLSEFRLIFRKKNLFQRHQTFLSAALSIWVITSCSADFHFTRCVSVSVSDCANTNDKINLSQTSMSQPYTNNEWVQNPRQYEAVSAICFSTEQVTTPKIPKRRDTPERV